MFSLYLFTHAFNLLQSPHIRLHLNLPHKAKLHTPHTIGISFNCTIYCHLSPIVGVIDVTILPRIETQGLTREDVIQLVDKMYNLMSSHLEDVSNNPNNNIDKIKDI